MRYIDILAAFETEINKIDDAVGKPQVDDSLYWLNQAVGKFIKLRFNGDFTHHTGYEQTEKRREDLIRLFDECKWSGKELTPVTKQPSYDYYDISYPEDFLYILNENVIIAKHGAAGTEEDPDYAMDTSVFECTRDSYMYRVTNSLTDFHYRYHRARPLRIRHEDGCQLLTDKKYDIKEYSIAYLRKPTEITMNSPFGEYEDFEDIVMPEIIKMAAQMYLENQKDDRYQSISNEILTQE